MEEKKVNLNDPTPVSGDKFNKEQANPASEIQEGQEDSSILHDKPDPNKEIHNVTKKDISSTNQEEFIDNDENTAKKDS